MGEGVGCLLISKELPLRISKDGLPRPMSLAEAGERRMSNEARPRIARGVGEDGEGDVAADGLLGLAPVIPRTTWRSNLVGTLGVFEAIWSPEVTLYEDKEVEWLGVSTLPGCDREGFLCDGPTGVEAQLRPDDFGGDIGMCSLPFTAITGVFPFAGDALDCAAAIGEDVATLKFRATGDGGEVEVEGRRNADGCRARGRRVVVLGDTEEAGAAGEGIVDGRGMCAFFVTDWLELLSVNVFGLRSATRSGSAVSKLKEASTRAFLSSSTSITTTALSALRHCLTELGDEPLSRIALRT